MGRNIMGAVASQDGFIAYPVDRTGSGDFA